VTAPVPGGQPGLVLTVWEELTQPQTAAPRWLVASTAVLALLAVGVPRAWPVTRNLVTIAHEGAHALAALAVGRRLAGIRVHSDTSGVTVSEGRLGGPGMVVTAFAGYVGPSLLGLVAAAALAGGYVPGMLWGALALLVAMLLQIRNVHGALALLVSGTALFAASWWGPEVIQSGMAHVLAWFLLLAGPRPIAELQAKRRRGAAGESDADQLARLTGLPGIVWVGLFAVTALACLGLGGWWLLT
jgi:hypothetical protein